MGERTSYTPGTFCWAELSTSDPGAAKDFYSGLLGWEYTDLPAPHGVYTMCQLGGKDVAALTGLGQEGMPTVWTNYVATDDADGVAARAQELGASIYAGPFDVGESGRMAVLSDPQGAAFALWQAKQHVGALLVNELGAMSWNDLLAKDLEAAREFYGDLFGWTTTDVADGQYFSIDNHGVQNGGMMTSPLQDVPPFWQPYFAVGDLDAALGTAQELGGRLLGEPVEVPAGRFAPLMDPQGGVFSLFSGPLDP